MLSLLQAEQLTLPLSSLLLQNPVKLVRRHRFSGLEYPDTLLLAHPLFRTNAREHDPVPIRLYAQLVAGFEMQLLAQSLRDHDTAGIIQGDGI